jgi:hypothetical protein
LQWYDQVTVETRMGPTGCQATPETEEAKAARENKLRTLAKRLAWEDDVKVVEAAMREVK